MIALWWPKAWIPDDGLEMSWFSLHADGAWMRRTKWLQIKCIYVYWTLCPIVIYILWLLASSKLADYLGDKPMLEHSNIENCSNFLAENVYICWSARRWSYSPGLFVTICDGSYPCMIWKLIPFIKFPLVCGSSEGVSHCYCQWVLIPVWLNCCLFIPMVSAIMRVYEDLWQRCETLNWGLLKSWEEPLSVTSAFPDWLKAQEMPCLEWHLVLNAAS